MLLVSTSNLFAVGKFKLDDFSIRLEQLTVNSSNLWVNSGYTTVNPEYKTVMDVNEFYSPPFAAKKFNLGIEILADSIFIGDNGNYGKGDVGLLYASGTWFPNKIVRNGTYHHLKNNQLYSLAVTSELIPMSGSSGFIEKIIIKNRSNHTIHLKLTPHITPGIPFELPLNKWGFGTPTSNILPAKEIHENNWRSESATIELYRRNTESLLLPGKTMVSYFSVLINSVDKKLPEEIDEKQIEDDSRINWEKKLETYTKNIPSLESNIEGLDNYYKRSILSGLICIWENPSFILNPYISTCGIDGGGMNCYLWDAGYCANMLSLMLGDKIEPLIDLFTKINLDEYYSYTPNGTGNGVSYSYSTWAFVNLVWAMSRHQYISPKLFTEAKRMVAAIEQRPKWNNLIDFGVQHNLLEMRSTGWEHYVVSPNTERAWCLKRLSDLNDVLDNKNKESFQWRNQSDSIISKIRSVLWDDKKGWFKCIFPNGYTDYVYSIQVYDAMQAGACNSNMRDKLLSHLVDGDFLFTYGVSSVSAIDSAHFEFNDPDWGGSGAYTGEAPQLALAVYEQNKPELAFDILKRLFWMGKYLPYYPQEHYVEKPSAPSHKRSNEVSGLLGAEAILYGTVGLDPRIDGSLWLRPQVPINAELKITDYRWRNNRLDISFKSGNCNVLFNNKQIYSGKQKLIQIK